MKNIWRWGISFFCFFYCYGQELETLIESPYTKILKQAEEKWPPSFLSSVAVNSESLTIRAWKHPERKYVMGFEQQMKINAPIHQVKKIIEDIDQYSTLFPGYVAIRVEEKKTLGWKTYWEPLLPLGVSFFYRLWYFFREFGEKRKSYRYQLIESDRLIFSDGLIMVEALPEGGTRYTEVDFFEGQYGILQWLAPKSLWKAALEGFYLSDMAIKLKAEHPEWTSQKIQEEAKKKFEEYSVEEVISHSKTLTPSFFN